MDEGMDTEADPDDADDNGLDSASNTVMIPEDLPIFVEVPFSKNPLTCVRPPNGTLSVEIAGDDNNLRLIPDDVTACALCSHEFDPVQWSEKKKLVTLKNIFEVLAQNEALYL
eukprot:gene2345-2700_t